MKYPYLQRHVLKRKTQPLSMFSHNAVHVANAIIVKAK